MDLIESNLVHMEARTSVSKQNVDHFTRLLSKMVYKSRVVIVQENCLLSSQEFFFSHRTWQELVDLTQYVHDISICKCGCRGLDFISYPNEYPKKESS